MNSQVTNIKPFPSITKQHALAIAARALIPHGGQFECYSQKPASCRIYGIYTDQPCWYIFAPWAGGMLGLRSSRLLVISRLNGKILYNGSAGDEG